MKARTRKAKSTENKPSAFDQVTERILEALEAGVVPWRKTWTGSEPISSRGRPYRGINALVLACAPYQSPVWLTFNQARALGGNVKRGEHGWKVLLWKVSAKDEAAEAPATGEKSRVFATVYTVFNLEQCENVTLPASVARKVAGNAVEALPAAEQIAAGYSGPTVRHVGAQPCYSPLLDEVRIPAASKFESGAEYFSTLFHELVHSTGHESRLARELKGWGAGADDSYSEEELVAEIGAAQLCARSGIENARTFGNSVSYLKHWIAKLRDDRRILMRAASAAQKAVDLIAPFQAADDDLTADAAETVEAA